jgi:hypothetical protein
MKRQHVEALITARLDYLSASKNAFRRSSVPSPSTSAIMESVNAHECATESRSSPLMRGIGGVHVPRFTVFAGALGFFSMVLITSANDTVAWNRLLFADAASVNDLPVAKGIGDQRRTVENHLRMCKSQSHTSKPNIPFDQLVTRIKWPHGRDGTDKTLIAYGPTVKNPVLGHSSQPVSWIVDVTNVAAVDVSINGKRIDNPTDAKQAHTAIYRLGGQSIPGYTGREGHFNWTVWPAGEFRFAFTVYDDAGNVIGTMSHRIRVAPMPKEE